MCERSDEVAALGGTILAVGFSPPEALAALAGHLDWPWPFLADEKRALYERLGLGRARRRDVVTRGTLRIYRQAAARGEAVRRPVEDYLQLGGDAVVAGGSAVRVFRPRSPDDRPSVDELLIALGEAAARGA